MLEKSTLERLDKLAYNRPDVVPDEITRTDRAAYRVYFRFMCCLYLMYRSGSLDSENLRKIKAAFMKDFELYGLFQSAAVQGAKEFRKLNAALFECRKNGDNCGYCHKIAAIRGAAVTADEPDIDAEGLK